MQVPFIVPPSKSLNISILEWLWNLSLKLCLSMIILCSRHWNSGENRKKSGAQHVTGSEKRGSPCSTVHSLGELEKNTPLLAFRFFICKNNACVFWRGDIHKSSTNVPLSMCSLTWCDTNDLTIVRPGYGAERLND